MALSRHHSAFSRPLNVEEVTKEAQNFEFRTDRPLQQWLRAAKMLLTEAAVWEQEGNYSMAFCYLYRHCQLVMIRLPDHPDYKDPRYKLDLKQAHKSVNQNLEKLEEWKPLLNREHHRYAKAMERQDAERKKAQETLDGNSLARQSFDQSQAVSMASIDASSIQTLDANEHRDFAVDLARREIRRRDAIGRSTRQAGISPATVASRRQGFVAKDIAVDEDITKSGDGVREAGQYLYRQPNQERTNPSQPSHQPRLSSFQYPTVPKQESRIDWNEPPTEPQQPPQTRYQLPPALPAKESIHSYQNVELPAIPPRPRSPPPPAVPSKYTFKPSTTTESGSPLRRVFLPPDLRTKFLNLASANTAQNLETCGILAATLISNALFINHLIIPDQTSTSDTCDTTPAGDNALFDYCSEANLLVTGWIHTHPSQSCFLSSRDLHTSSGYQVMLPEAVAIVCAPRHTPDWGIFRLTDPPGLKHVLGCEEKGLFHPHEETNLYTDALRPGHVVEGPGLEFSVVDLRRR